MDGTKMEGWLYVIHPYRLRIRFPKKRYFVLEGRQAACYKSKPLDDGDKVSLKKGLIHPFTKILDNGREHVHGQLLHSFTLSDPNNGQNQLKLAAKSAEDAAKWMSAFKVAAEQSEVFEAENILSHPRKKPGFRIPLGREPKTQDIASAASQSDWTELWTSKASHDTPDVITDSPWKILGCKNGLRLFRESSKGRFRRKVLCGPKSDDHPAIMAVGVVKATCESIFETVMALGPSRAEWDFCFRRGRIIEHIDGHTDIVHKQLRRRWLPGHMRPRDLLFHRYWRREYDGSYVILYHSMTHKSCPPRSGVVRANLKSGGYVISPLTNAGEYPARSLIRHMLEIDWKTWKSHFKPSRVQKITLRMLERIAGLRDFYKAKPRKPVAINLAGDEVKEDNATDGELVLRDAEFKSARFDESTEDAQESFLRLNDTDEFFDAPDDSDQEESLHDLSESEGTEDHESSNKQGPKLSAAATLVKRLHEIAASAQKRAQAEDVDTEGTLDREGTLPKCSPFNSYCCWNVADPGTFLIRGKNYLRDHHKVKAKDTLMQLVAVDWFKSNERDDHVAARENAFMQKPRVRKLSRCFFFIVNFQVPGSTTYSLVLYYMMRDSLGSFPLLERFVNESDRFRNSHFKLIPHVAEGSWIVKQSVGKTACLIGEALDINYFHGKNYLELDVDVGSSSVAKGVVSLVFGYMSKLVVEMAFLVQANTEDELPEVLLGTCRISSLDVSKAVQITPQVSSS